MKSRKEIEAKFIVSDLEQIRRRLVDLGGSIAIPRHSERNLYFDTPNRRLRSGKQVLRIRTDPAVRMTYKRQDASFEDRTEIELTLDDAAEGRALLCALGFEPVLGYEKHRETFSLDGVLVMLDELPFGNFVEVEGAALDTIREASSKLGFDWQKRLQVSYLALFERARDHLGLSTHDASFEEWGKLPPLRAEDLGLVDAEQANNPCGIAS